MQKYLLKEGYLLSVIDERIHADNTYISIVLEVEKSLDTLAIKSYDFINY